MTPIRSKENVQGENAPSAASEFTQIVITLRDGNLHFTSKNGKFSENIFANFQDVQSEIFKTKQKEVEVHIEIIRNNPDVIEEHSIENISSAYEAFWKSNFQSCLDRRTCSKCGKIFLTPQQLFHHLQNLHEISNPQECFVCHKFFSNELERMNHLFQSHNLHKPDLTCEACFKICNNELDKKAHLLVHTDKNKCKWCSQYFPCAYLLNCHLQNCSFRRNDLVCQICGCLFRSTHILQLHSLRHSRVTCEICQLNFLSVSEASLEDPEILFVKHLKSTHCQGEVDDVLTRLKKRDEEEENLDNLFMSQIEKNLSQLRDSIKQNQKKEDHFKDDQNKEPNKCDVESSVAACQCSECFKTFESVDELIRHELDHQNPFSCCVCCQKFPHRRGFKKHMHTHGIQVKPDSVRYSCKQCSVKCTTMSALRTHLLTHTNQKPHLCDKCGLKFRRLHALKVHEFAVHDSRILHHCPQCNASSVSKSSLLRHVQCVHGGVRRFICGICSTRWFQNQGLRRHLKNVHKLEFPPMESLCKKSNSEIHVIPPPENLLPTDPLVGLLKFAVHEEQLKLDLLKKQDKLEENLIGDSHQCSKSSIDGQSLNILGDVASKASPIQQIDKTTPFLQISAGVKLQELTRFICTGCQHTADSLEDLSVHSTKCQGEKTLSFLDEESSGIPPKPPVVYSLTSSFSSNASTSNSSVPYQLCVVPPLNRHLLTGAMSSTDKSVEHPVLPLSGSLSVASNDLEFSNTHQLELLDSASFSFQEEYFIRGESSKAISGLNQSDAEFLPQTNSITYNDSDILENSKQTEAFSFRHDGQDNILSEDSGLKINEMATKQVENIVSTFFSGHTKVKDVSNPELIINVPAHGGMVQEVSSILTPSLSVDNVISEPNQVVQLSCEKKSFSDGFKMNESAHGNSCSHLSKHSAAKQESSTLRGKHSNPSSGSVVNTTQECPECGKQLSSASSFKRHLDTHFGGKPYECSHCGKCFRYKFNLTVHVRSHTGARPFGCTECGKNFRYQSELKEHKQSHNESKLFNCLDCGQKFARVRDLRRHSLSHKDSAKPACHICQKTFSRADYLKRHMKSHKSPDLINIEGLQDSKRHPEKAPIHSNKTSSQEEPLNVRRTQPKSSKNKRKLAQETSKETTKQSHKSSTKPAAVQVHKPDATHSCQGTGSGNLISLAYQAAEDGVEIMFVEEIKTSANDTEANPGAPDADSIAMYVQIRDSARMPSQ